MSQLIIHYSSLEDGGRKAKKAGEELSEYAKQAQSKIASKISSYSGEHTGNISAAQGYINQKIMQLNKKSAAFLQYANDVDKFAQAAREADKNVKVRIEKISGTFKSNYGIKDGMITQIFNYFSDKLNESALGRFFKDMAQVVAKSIVSLKDSIVEWYKYEGGKYIVDAVLAVGAAVLAVCSIVAAVLSGGALIVVLAGVFVGIVALLNAVTDFRNSLIAYGKEKQGDPAWAKRYGDLDTMTDTIRAKSNDIAAHTVANVVDAAEFVANVILIVNSGIKLFKNVKTVANSYGGFKEYFRYQYKTNSQGVSVVKNALVGNAGEKARAKELLKLYGKGKITDLKNMAKLYVNPRNWLTKTTQRANIGGYSQTIENLGFSKVSDIYNGSSTLKGLSGILDGTDKSFLNIATTVNKAESLYKSITSFKNLEKWKLIGVSHLTLDKNGELKNVTGSVSDITGLVDKIGKQMKKFTKLFNNVNGLHNTINLKSLRQSLQGA